MILVQILVRQPARTAELVTCTMRATGQRVIRGLYWDYKRIMLARRAFTNLEASVTR